MNKTQKWAKLNQITTKFAKKFYSSFDDFSPIKDYPVDKNFLKTQELEKRVKTVAFFGGSQGAFV
jgi:UDP-N-acetylglucosamine--N-acetylmuramyl-(pentapeptide) pyrophosphoryl-undecaprenol N-acetylglucosamine transferase